MSEYSDISFTEDQLTRYGQVVTIFQKILAESKLSGLEYLTLQLSDVIEQNGVPLPEGEPGNFIHEVVAKALNEAWGLIGCLRAGAYTSSFHHARSIIELYAAMSFFFSNQKKIAKRAKKFFAYKKIYFLNHYTGLKKQLLAGDISQEVYNERCLVTDEMFQEMQNQNDELAKLYKVSPNELYKVESWHYPARISNLLEAAFARKHIHKSNLVNGNHNVETFDDLSKIYNQFCEMTHLSPLTYSLVGTSLMMGYPSQENGKIDYKALNRPISVAIIVLADIVELLEEELKLVINIKIPDF